MDKEFVSMWNLFKSIPNVGIFYVKNNYIRKLFIPILLEQWQAKLFMQNFFVKLFQITAEPFHFAYLMYVQENDINDEQLKKFKTHKHFNLTENANAFRMMLNSVVK